jgi:hypothetical protein
MRDNSVLSQFTSRVSPLVPKSEPEPEADACGEDNLGAFGWLRGVRDRAVMLELRRRDGSTVALSDSWLERIDFDASDGIALKFGGQTIRIVGRNLNAEARPGVRLLDGLCRHRVPWVREFSERDALVADKRSLVIEEIIIENWHTRY